MSYQQSTLQKKLEIELDAIPVVVKIELIGSGYLQQSISCLTSPCLIPLTDTSNQRPKQLEQEGAGQVPAQPLSTPGPDTTQRKSIL